MGKADRARGSASSEHGPLIHHPATELLGLFFFFFFSLCVPSAVSCDTVVTDQSGRDV